MIRRTPLVCKECHLPFWRWVNFHAHTRAHRRSEQLKRFKCHVCGIIFARSLDLDLHARMHYKKKPHCVNGKSAENGRPVNSQKFKKFDDRTKKQLSASEKGGPSRGSDPLPSVRPTSEEKTATASPFKCHGCQSTFQNLGPYRIHLRLCKWKQAIHCKQCGMAFNLMAHYVNHRKSCGAANSMATVSDESKTNDVSTMNETDAAYKCRLCHEHFGSPNSLYKHGLATHPGEKVFKCSKCDKCFLRHAQVKSHEPTHSGVKPFKCNKCGSQFYHHGTLMTHMKIHSKHAFTCQYCGRKFVGRVLLMRHTWIHTGERPYMCEICGQTFNCTNAHKKHVERTHTRERSHQCHVCGSKFNAQVDLNNHMMRHTGYRPHKCSHCTKSFYTKHDKRKHERRHSKQSSRLYRKPSPQQSQPNELNDPLESSSSEVNDLIDVKGFDLRIGKS